MTSRRANTRRKHSRPAALLRLVGLRKVLVGRLLVRRTVRSRFAQRTGSVAAGAVALAAAAAAVGILRAHRRAPSVPPADNAVRDHVLIGRPRPEVYWLRNDVSRLAAALGFIHVDVIDSKRSRWQLPDGRVCDVEVLGDVPEMVVAWRVSSGPLPHDGRAEVSDADGRGTWLAVDLRCPPKVAVDHAQQQLADGLEHIRAALTPEAAHRAG